MVITLVATSLLAYLCIVGVAWELIGDRIMKEGDRPFAYLISIMWPLALLWYFAVWPVSAGRAVVNIVRPSKGRHQLVLANRSDKREVKGFTSRDS